MIITVDARSATPPFEQLRVQIIGLIASGSMIAGTRLPTVRRLATDLRLSPNTVARSYKELEAAGFIETRGRAGSFVKAPEGSTEREALRAAHTYVQRMKELGVTPADAVAFITATLQT